MVYFVNQSKKEEILVQDEIMKEMEINFTRVFLFPEQKIQENVKDDQKIGNKSVIEFLELS